MSALYLYDDAVARRFEPFISTRPCGELRAGAVLTRERWVRALGMPVAGHVTADHLREFAEFAAPPCLAAGELPAGTVIANARGVPMLDPRPHADVWHIAGRVAAVRLSSSLPVSQLANGSLDLASLVPRGAVSDAALGWWLERPWDLIRHLAEMLTHDIAALAPGVERGAVSGVTILGSHELIVEHGACIEPLVVCDTSAGPILVRAGATVACFTRLVGPCVIGRDTQVLGGKVATSSIGESCRVHGELSTSILLGHVNKGHDGFVGHSILGRWTNLGASTVTSNLKNTYGTVHLWAPDGECDTGLQFLGTLLGDHAKTAIGTRLMTGTVIGAGASVVSDGPPPRVIAPFAFGGGVYRLEKFLEVAAKVMARRQVTLGKNERAHLVRVYGARWFLPA